jgi:hypothetical protein
MCQIFVQAVFAQMLSVVAWQRSVALTVDATLTQRWLSQMQHVGILVHAPTLMLMMTNAAWARECVRKPTAMTATRSWQTLQIIVLMPHVQMVNVVVRQQHAQIMVAARMAHQCVQTMPALTATHQGHAKTATQMTQLADSTRAHRACATASARSWQSLQLFVVLPHAQTQCVVVRQRNAQVMVVARRAR